MYTCTHDYTLGKFRLFIDLPYRDAFRNLSRACGFLTQNEAGLHVAQRSLAGGKLLAPTIDWTTRTLSALVGVALLIPVVNIVVDIALRVLFYFDHSQHSLDLRTVTDSKVIDRRIHKAASQASYQQWWDWPGIAFGHAIDKAVLKFQGYTDSYNIGGKSVGVAELQGRRPSMEDHHLATEFSFHSHNKRVVASAFGIFDGHGGSGASHFVSRNMRSYLSYNLSKYCKQGVSDAGVYQALRQTFLELDRAYGGEAGTTATLAVVIDGDLWIANAGDSRAVLKNGDSNLPLIGYSVQQLSKDLNPDDSACKKGIKRRGGVVTDVHGVARINSTLAVARAIGDTGVLGSGGKTCVSPLPKVTKVPKNKIQPGSELIIACDGLWDVASSKQAANAVKKAKDQGLKSADIAAKIAQAAYDAGSTDNISVMVVSL
ncbi:MAG: PP2C family protein-serine/threonine phosphatase [Chlamydiales bacterium]|nr:PP2C family protein-serine/threonine phosphatase [Chlamydiales bacterium]